MSVRAYADGQLIYDLNMDELALLELKATCSVDKAGTATLTLPAGHPAYNAFVSFRTVVEIHKDDDLRFRGRALFPARDLYGARTITCEGERGFLRDAVVEPYLYQAAPAVIFSDLISRYNAQVDAFKRFRLGVVTATDPNGYVRMESESAELVSEVLDKLIERVGGYITFTSDASGQRIINWLGSLDEVSPESIDFGENLLDLTDAGTNTELATVIFPYGAKNETTGERVTIEAVNDGRRYIKDDAAVALRGWIAKPVYWDDVTLAGNLLRKAQQYLASSKLIVSTLDVSAVGIDAREGVLIPVRSEPHGIDDLFLLRERDYDFLDPGQDRITLGRERATLTGADVVGDKNALAQLRRTEQSLKTDYTIMITDAVASVANK